MIKKIRIMMQGIVVGYKKNRVLQVQTRKVIPTRIEVMPGGEKSSVIREIGSKV